MKQNIFKIFLFFFLGAIMVSCAENFEELDKGHDVLKLSANNSDIVLSEAFHNDAAIELSWSTGTNNGSGNKISYTLEIAKEGADYATGYSEEIGTGIYKWSKTVGELNQLLFDEFDVTYGEKINLNARIIATVIGLETKEQISEISFNVTSYSPVSASLFMVGDATPTDWNFDNPTPMEYTDLGQFTWTGKLRSNGSFKFITTVGNMLPSYNRDGSDNSKLTLRTDDQQPDEKFTVEKDGTYKVTVNLLSLTITIVESAENPARFEEVFFVGSFTGWNFIPMKKDALTINLFHYGAVFEWIDGGEFKFGTMQSWDDMLVATTANAPYTSTGVVYKSKDDNKWLLNREECGKAYKIALVVTKGAEKMIMKPYTGYNNLYLVGSASPSGWDLGNATEMTPTENPFIHTWTGTLNEGELKISCDKSSDWMGAWFMPMVKDQEPTGNDDNMLFIDKSDNDLKALYPDVNINDVDLKWKIKSTGNYEITVNQLAETIKITKK